MAFNVEEILAQLDAESEKTAEATFLDSITEEESKEVSEEKVAEAAEQEGAEDTTEEKVAAEAETTEEVEEAEEEKVATGAEAEEVEATEEDSVEEPTEEKTASEDSKEAEESSEKVAQVIPSDEQLVKMATEFGKIAAYALFNELAAMGVAMPTNKDMAVPPVSQASRPTDSPVTVAKDAKEQEAAGHDAYDTMHNHKPDGTGGMMKEKKASLVNGEFLANLYTKIYSPEDN